MADGATEIWMSREEVWKTGCRRWCIEDGSLDEMQRTFARRLAIGAFEISDLGMCSFRSGLLEPIRRMSLLRRPSFLEQYIV